MRNKNDKNCALKLIGLVDQPKAWRVQASKVLIDFEHKIRRIEVQTKAVIGLCVIILGVLIKLAVT